MQKHKVVIIGAGPTGLGAAYRLQELSELDFMLYERNSYVGGLASSFLDPNGFWWDIGGHVQFSHYKYFDDLMDKLLSGEWIHHERVSYVWMLNRFIPYPFQNNIHRLPKPLMQESLSGLIKSQTDYNHTSPKNFAEWILQTYGEGIAKYFLFPYNFKVWAYKPEEMNSDWVGERVAVTDIQRVVKNIMENTDDVSWGPNNTFRYPKNGGTGEIWRLLGKRIPSKNIALNYEVKQVDIINKTVTFTNGEIVGYEFLVSTMPIDQFINISNFSEKIKTTANKLKHSSTYIVGIGLQGKPSKELSKICWMYFPESNCPFYRATLFSKYSPNNVPDNQTQFSLMLEISESPKKKVNQKTLIEDTIKGLKATRLISDKDKIISKWLRKEEYGYPTPSLERDEILSEVQSEFMKCNILSRGRFGMWKYEVSNQDHSLMQGVEAADYIIHGSREVTAWYPNVVNGPKPF